MNKLDTPVNGSLPRTFYTNPGTGIGIPCTVLDEDGDGQFLIRLDKLAGEVEGWVTAGDLYLEDESGRYLGGPR
jgi:hypothetical protein